MKQTIRIAGIVEESITDGPGIRYTIFLQGCLHKCPGCHNPQTHDLDGGQIMAADEIIKSINLTNFLKGVTFSGGEPFLQAEVCHYIASKIKKEYDVICYTGYTYENLSALSFKQKDIRDFLNDIDYLIDGKFELDKKSLALNFKGSTNQRIINIKETIKSGRVIEENF